MGPLLRGKLKFWLKKGPLKNTNMKTLLIYPEYPPTFWSFKHALKFIGAKAAFPPLGLLTVAAMLPDKWPKRLVDLNVTPLTEEHLGWAEVAFISAMSIQSESAQEIINRCNSRGLKIVAGGPHFTHFHKETQGVDHLVLGEAEEVVPELAADLEAGLARPVYRCQRYPNLNQTPAPLWELIDFKNYTSMCLQVSRGCPFDCEFCDVVLLFGRRPRYKLVDQCLRELDGLYKAGWQGNVMFVDDNFVGNRKLAEGLCTAIIEWQARQNHPFFFVTQASINLADEPKLLSLMAEADFRQVFIGIETPSSEALEECNKHQNRNRDLTAAVKQIASYGLEVMGGFIVGFDSDQPTIFDDQISFIETANIPEAMVGMLSVMPGTRLGDRIEAEGRLLGIPSGNNAMDLGALNFEPRMGRDSLVAGYKKILKALYEPPAFYDRAWRFLENHQHQSKQPFRLPQPREVRAFFRLLWELGVRAEDRRSFWKYFGRVVKQKKDLNTAMNLCASGYHFWQTSRDFVTRDE